jgi:hypothetical protein
MYQGILSSSRKRKLHCCICSEREYEQYVKSVNMWMVCFQENKTKCEFWTFTEQKQGRDMQGFLKQAFIKKALPSSYKSQFNFRFQIQDINSVECDLLCGCSLNLNSLGFILLNFNQDLCPLPFPWLWLATVLATHLYNSPTYSPWSLQHLPVHNSINPQEGGSTFLWNISVSAETYYTVSKHPEDYYLNNIN